jgi:hypothetical protein
MFSFRIKRRGRLYRVTVLPELRHHKKNPKALGKLDTESRGTKREKPFQRLRLGLLTYRTERLNGWPESIWHKPATCLASESTAWPIF